MKEYNGEVPKIDYRLIGTCYSKLGDREEAERYFAMSLEN